MKKTGELSCRKAGGMAFLWALSWPHLLASTSLLTAIAPSALAASQGEVQFTAQADRPQVSIDEFVSLKMTVQSEGGTRMSEPQFTAPDFDVVNEYTGSQVESYYDSSSGRINMRNTQQVTKVLKPRKTGTLRIRGIRVNVGGKELTAPEVVVQVFGSGAGTPPPRGYGGGGLGLRGAAKRTLGPSVKVRAEVDKQRVYKGEQVIVSYYLYRRVRVANIQVDKFPVLNGFLREDLEMPVMGQRLDTERVVLDGAPFERSLLMRYAAYPLQSGKLTIDSTSMKYVYYPGSDSMDDEDPFFGLFRQMQPQQGRERSEVLEVEVMPLPEEGKPNSFTGGVGDFTLASAVDKYDVRANEALTLKFKIEGRGNLAAIGEPKAKWPENVEIYDTKGTAKSGRLGVGEKVFEYMLIPRVPGELELPAMELSFFDPAKQAYVTRATEPIKIRVSEGAPGSGIQPRGKSATGGASDVAQGQGAEEQKSKPSGFKDFEVEAPPSKLPAWRYLYWLCIATFLGLVGLVCMDLFRNSRLRSNAFARSKAKSESRSWPKLHESARQANQGASWQQVTQTYEALAAVTFDAIDQTFEVNARSRPRSQLKEILVGERGVPAPLWERVSKLLEYAETVRFASSAGAISEQAARTELARWVSEGEAVEREMVKLRPSS